MTEPWLVLHEMLGPLLVSDLTACGLYRMRTEGWSPNVLRTKSCWLGIYLTGLPVTTLLGVEEHLVTKI